MKVQTNLNLIQHTFNKLSTFFTLSTMLNDLFKRPRFNNCVEHMLKQMSKPFKQAVKVVGCLQVSKMFASKKSAFYAIVNFLADRSVKPYDSSDFNRSLG